METTTEKKGCFGQENWSFGFPYKPFEIILGFQHLFAFFGATVLVPLITGMNPSTALATAGIGTLVFHYLTKLKVPVFLGSSFAFIGAIINTVIKHPVEGPQYACGGVMIAAIVSFILAWVIYFVGIPKVEKLFPPVITGTIIVVIGVGLAYSGVNDFFGLQDNGGEMNHFYFIHQWASILIGTFTLCVVICCMAYMRNFLSLIPILVGMLAGYILCLILRACTLPTIDFQPIIDEKWINLPYGYYYLKPSNKILGGIFMLPKWDWVAILSIAPLAFVTFMEHIGDITTIGRIVNQDFFADPGLHRTMAADAIGSFVAGFLGGPEITTYSENTGVLATTKVFDPRILRLAALYAIVLAFFGKFGGILRSIPAPVKGAVSLVLFGIIAACGISGIVEAHVDLSKTRNLIIVSLILSVGLGVNTATYANGGTSGILVWFGKNTSFGLSGLFLCTIVGVVANLVLPEKSFSEINEEKEKNAKDLNESGSVDVENKNSEAALDTMSGNNDTMGGNNVSPVASSPPIITSVKVSDSTEEELIEEL